jgi:hypothetical protein
LNKSCRFVALNRTLVRPIERPRVPTDDTVNSKIYLTSNDGRGAAIDADTDARDVAGARRE